MKKSLVLWFALSSVTTFAQPVFDYATDFSILKELSRDSTSQYSYTRLLARFNDFDTTLTQREILGLMIGFTNDINYKPYHTVSEERALVNLALDGKFDEALKASSKFLARNPVNFSALFANSISHLETEGEKAILHRERMLLLIDAILVSGDGSIEHPYFVLSPTDGQVLIRYIFGRRIGIMGSSHDKHDYFLDMLEMVGENGEPKRLYFNIDHAVEKMFTPEERESMKVGLEKREKRKKKRGS